jgi:hypothetical protein
MSKKIRFADMTLDGARFTVGRAAHTLVGAHATVDDSGDVAERDRSRLSVTRLLLLGPLAVAAPKRKKVKVDSRRAFLTVAGPGWSQVRPVKPDELLAARTFAAALNAAAALSV